MLQQRVELLTAQAKRVVREARIVVQQAARLHENLQPDGHKENEDGNTEEDR